jgi:uncharacterized membrane protein YccF (DUF307 family)
VVTDLPAGNQPSTDMEQRIVVPPAMLEPAQAIDAAIGTELTESAMSVAIATQKPSIIVTNRRTGPGFISRAFWFIFVGWWLTGFAIGFAWLCSITLVLLPITYMIVNKIPTILTLRPRSMGSDVTVEADGTVRITTGGAIQRPFWQRALWFVFVGWWACGLAMTVAYVLSLTVILLPIGLMIFNRVPAVMTLQRN